MRKFRMLALLILLAVPGGCSDTPPEESAVVKSVESAQEKAREMQDEENKRVDEVNEAMDE